MGFIFFKGNIVVKFIQKENFMNQTKSGQQDLGAKELLLCSGLVWTVLSRIPEKLHFRLLNQSYNRIQTHEIWGFSLPLGSLQQQIKNNSVLLSVFLEAFF